MAHMVVCGRAESCGSTGAFLSPDTTDHEVRCCADTQPNNSGWQRNAGCKVWGGSDEGFACAHGLPYVNASSLCIMHGGRLCTMPELEANCASGTGCMHDIDHVWSSTLANSSTNYPTGYPTGYPTLYKPTGDPTKYPTTKYPTTNYPTTNYPTGFPTSRYSTSTPARTCAEGGLFATVGYLNLCCSALCKECGGIKCGLRIGGADNCCSSAIEQGNRTCGIDTPPCKFREWITPTSYPTRFPSSQPSFYNSTRYPTPKWSGRTPSRAPIPYSTPSPTPVPSVPPDPCACFQDCADERCRIVCPCSTANSSPSRRSRGADPFAYLWLVVLVGLFAAGVQMGRKCSRKNHVAPAPREQQLVLSPANGQDPSHPADARALAVAIAESSPAVVPGGVALARPVTAWSVPAGPVVRGQVQLDPIIPQAVPVVHGQGGGDSTVSVSGGSGGGGGGSTRSFSERLARVGDLQKQGLISEAEYAEARKEIIRDA
jgi:hypothetical protein